MKSTRHHTSHTGHHNLHELSSDESKIQESNMILSIFFSNSNILLCFFLTAGGYYPAQAQCFPFVQPAAFLVFVPQQLPSQPTAGSQCPPKRERKLVVCHKCLLSEV